MMYGVSAPPALSDERYALTVFTGVAQALPARASGMPWRYALLTTNLGATHFVSWGTDSSIDATVTPYVGVVRTTSPVLVNMTGATFVSGSGTGGGAVAITPVDNIAQGGSGVLRSPPQIANSATFSTAAAATVAIPNNGAGVLPKYLMLSFDSATAVLIGVGLAGTTAAHFYMNRESGPVIINVAGQTHIRHAAVAGANLVLAPLEY